MVKVRSTSKGTDPRDTHRFKARQQKTLTSIFQPSYCISINEDTDVWLQRSSLPALQTQTQSISVHLTRQQDAHPKAKLKGAKNKLDQKH